MRDLENQKRLAKIWYSKNKQLTIQRAKEWAALNPTARRETQRRYAAANKELLKQKTYAWRKKNPDKARAIGRRAYNPETKKAWAARNKSKLCAASRKWRRLHPEKTAAFHAARRALKQKIAINPKMITEFIRVVRSRKWVRCYYCDTKVFGKVAHIDHVIALKGKKQGAHEIGNLCAACPKCNQSKSNKTLAEWNKQGQQILL
jgi:5-methylcytosine-specific restriction endonuclease McrA